MLALFDSLGELCFIDTVYIVYQTPYFCVYSTIMFGVNW